MSEKAKVVLTDYVWESLAMENEILGDLAEIVPLQVKDPIKFFPAAEDCVALLNTYAGPITAEVMARMPNCKIIARYGIGVDTIDLDAATEAGIIVTNNPTYCIEEVAEHTMAMMLVAARKDAATEAGIIVTNNPTYCIEEVAEHTMAMMLVAARKVAFYDRLVRDGGWGVPPGRPLYRLAGSTVGLVGFGNIARRVADAAAGLRVRVVYFDPYVEAGQFETPGEKRELDRLLRESDFVCVHAPLSAETRHLIGKNAFSQMKKTTILVNCARGPIVDTEALINALDEKEIAGCALDTTDPEPLPEDHTLRRRENVIISPHVAWYSEQSMAGLQAGAPNEVRRVLRGEWPVNVVNRAVKSKNRAGI